MQEQSREDQRRGEVSAAMDGQVEPQALQGWLKQSAGQAEVQQDWHLYHLIGDVMRSEELATTVQADRQLLQRVQQALAQEPTVLAPTALPTAARSPRVRRRLWAGSAAAVAGFLLVGSAYWLTRADGGLELSGASLVSVTQPVDDVHRASIGSERRPPASAPWALHSPVGEFREILRLPRGSAQRPHEAVQVLYSNGSATISVLIEPHRPGQHQPTAEMGERLNTLSLQRQDMWLTLTGDVPLGTLHQVAAALQPRP